jgi:pilus assembly protein CpaB
MKNTRALSMLLVSILVGISVTALAVNWVSQKGSIASNKVVVAIMDIELGSKLNPQMLTMVDWPSGSIPQGAFTTAKELQDRVVKTSIAKGEAILNAKLAPEGTQGGLSAVIAEGKRAITVRVNDVIGVAGFALPGNYVDVMVNAQQEKPDGKGSDAQQQISKTVLEHVLVLAVAQEASRDETKPKVVNAVTLEVSPADAEKLDLARNVGTLSLVLRNQLDKEPLATTGITKNELFGATPEPVVLAKAEPAQPSKPVRRAKRKAAPLPIVAEAPATPMPQRSCVEVVHDNTRVLNCFQ